MQSKECSRMRKITFKKEIKVIKMANPAKWDCSKIENHMAGARLLSFAHKRIKTSIKRVRKFNKKFN